MKRWLNIVAAMFALTAAIFWFLSAYGELPPMLTYFDGAPANDPFYQAIRFSAVMNKWAAFFSFGSAASMGMAGLFR